MAARYRAMQPVMLPATPVTMAGAVCGRDKLVHALQATSGPVVGYKAGLTNAAVQQRFNHDAPLRGTLLQAMILQDGAVVTSRFGARPLYEADLIAVVRSSAIHDARSPRAVLAQIAHFLPFIEMPDLMVEDPARLNGPNLTLVNVGSRLGVTGAPIPIGDPAAMVDALATMSVSLVDGHGKVLDSGKGAAILGNPLNAVIWLADDLKRTGITLKAGDLLSLGSFTRLLPPTPGSTIRAVYQGLPGTPSVSVQFR